MKKNERIFLVLGYGIPKNILVDENYNFYLKITFNTIFNIVQKNNITEPIIICTGGKTDMYPPYKRSEGEEMVRFFKHLIQKSNIKKVTKNGNLLQKKNLCRHWKILFFAKKLLMDIRIHIPTYMFFQNFLDVPVFQTLQKMFLQKKKYLCIV